MNKLDLWQSQGYALLPDVLSKAACAQLLAYIANSELKAGSRQLLHQPWCAALAKELAHHPALAALLPPEAVTVQCNLFQKTQNPSHGRNWLVPLHQDLSIPASGPVAAPGWHGWNMKEGMGFVQAPAQVLQQMVALRVHLDDCGPQDGALRVVPGSHLAGIVAEGMPSGAHEPNVLCTAQAGDVLALRPLLLHASSKATGAGRRRVLHFLYGPKKVDKQHSWALAVG